MNISNISEKEIVKIIELVKKGVHTKEISKVVNISHGTVSKIWNYYIGKNNKSVHTLGESSKNIIDKIKNRKNDKLEIKHYECTLFFGLIKLKFNPVY